MSENMDANLTLIGSGVQILPERYGSYLEQWGQPTKDRILSIMHKLKKSKVVFLSGDVHYAQFFQTSCQSYLGYNVPEVCSSGLTHVLSDISPRCEVFMQGHTPSIFRGSEIYMDHNFATIEINKEPDNDVKVRFSIRDKEGNEVIVKEYSVNNDLSLNSGIQRYSQMCKNTHKRAGKILMFNQLC